MGRGAIVSEISNETSELKTQDAIKQDSVVEEISESAGSSTSEESFSSQAEIIRQWISLIKGSCDVRVGSAAIVSMGDVMRGSVTTTRRSLLLVEEGSPAELVEETRRELTDAGFVVARYDLPTNTKRSIASVNLLVEALAQACITSDDLICAVGSSTLMSLAAYVSTNWCGATELCCVPCDLFAAISGLITPLGLDVAGKEELIRFAGKAKHAFIDFDFLTADLSCESAMHMRALMVQSALADSERSFSTLWDRADDIVAGDLPTLSLQIVDTLKSRGNLVAATSAAVRQSVDHGSIFVRALKTLLPANVPESTLLAESMRFASRLAAAQSDFAIDDVLAVDELLEKLELPLLQATVDPDQMIAALKAISFERSSRFLLGLPRSLGRVRLANVDEDLLKEHVSAWCAVHRVEE